MLDLRGALGLLGRRRRLALAVALEAVSGLSATRRHGTSTVLSLGQAMGTSNSGCLRSGKFLPG